MRIKVRQRSYGDGRVVWTADVHVQPAGEAEIDRFRVTAPPTVTTRAGAERWAMDQAKRIATQGRPRNTKRARQAKAEREAAERTAFVPTLAEFWPTFLESLQAERRKPNTIIAYTGVGERKLLPLLGATRLDRVTELDVQRLKVAMKSAAPTHVNLALGVVSQVLKLAKVHHPAVVMPTIKRVRNQATEHLRVYDHEQAAALVRVLAGRPERLATLLLALDAGLRRGEVNALRWTDVDFIRNELIVRHSLCLGELLTPKSGKARRVPLSARLAAALAELGRGSEWVLPRSTLTKCGGRHENTPMGLERILASAAKAAGVPNLRPHALRHTFATLLLAAGASLPSVSKLLGHSNVAITASVYCHHLPGQDQAAIARLDAFTSGPVAVVVPPPAAEPATGTLVSLDERRARGGQ